MSAVTDLKIVPAREEDEDAVFRFLLDSFFQDEPLNTVMKVPPKQHEWKPLSYVKNGYSFIAYARGHDREDTMVGVVLNNVRLKEDQENRSLQDNKSKIGVILEKLEEKADIWNRIRSDRVFSIVILSVSSKYRRLNVGRRLLEESVQRAMLSGLSHAVVECTSSYSARIVEKLGFERVCGIRYEDHKDENGEVIFKIEKPHVEIVKFLKTLSGRTTRKWLNGLNMMMTTRNNVDHTVLHCPTTVPIDSPTPSATPNAFSTEDSCFTFGYYSDGSNNTPGS